MPLIGEPGLASRDRKAALARVALSLALSREGRGDSPVGFALGFGWRDPRLLRVGGFHFAGYGFELGYGARH